MKNSLGAAIMATGIALSGYFVYLGISKYTEKDRCVTVKGLSERVVLANSVTWPMSVSVEGNDLAALYAEVDAKKEKVISFLKLNKIDEAEIFASAPSTNDRWEYNYEETVKKNKPRYGVSIDLTVNTHNTKRVMKLLSKMSELLKSGIDISTESYSIHYDYDDLASLKPEMVEEATKNARKVAEKFAEDAGCKLGSIVNATQGLFSIDEEYYKPQYKRIRVVTTVAYNLK